MKMAIHTFLRTTLSTTNVDKRIIRLKCHKIAKVTKCPIITLLGTDITNKRWLTVRAIG